MVEGVFSGLTARGTYPVRMVKCGPYALEHWRARRRTAVETFTINSNLSLEEKYASSSLQSLRRNERLCPIVNRTAVLVAIVATVLVISAFGYVESAPGQVTTASSSSYSKTSVSSTSSTTSSTIARTTSSTSTSMMTGCASPAGSSIGDWTTYHGNNSRTGDAAGVTSGRCTKFDWKSPALDGKVYAEPLVYQGRIIIATENDSIYSLNASNGSPIWRTHLGTPMQGTALPCGDINPTGITGTPVIDPGTGTVYVVAFEVPGAHHLVALDSLNGKIRFSVPADPPSADPLVQQERGALSFGNGRVYVPYGGLAGDCGNYHGWIVGLSADGSGGMVSYEVPTQREAGIWAPSGGAMDASGNLFYTTGNGASTSAFDFSNSVIELSPTLQELAYFAPANWVQLNNGDTDLGSVGPMIIGHGELFQIGKEGIGYLLDSANLGGIGGQVYSGQACSSAFGGTAYSGSTVFISCTDGLVALNVTASSFSVLWNSPNYSAGPPIVTGTVVWVPDTANNMLRGYEVHSGSEVFSAQIGNANRFTTPATGDGRIFVAAGDVIFSFKLGIQVP